MDLAITLLKLVAAAFAGGFGLLGLLTEYRDKNTHRITRWGRIALIGILVSTAVALVTPALEHSRDAKKTITAAIEARDASMRAESTLNNINRLLQPLKGIEVAFGFRIASDDPSLVAYLKRLRERLDEAVRNYATSGNANQPDGVMIIADEKRKVHEIDIWPKSGLLPSFSDPAGKLKLIAFDIDWYARTLNPIEVAEAQVQPDLRLNVVTSDYASDARLHTSYDPKQDRFALEGIFPKATIESDNGTIVSVLDVPRSTIVLRLLNKEPLTLEHLTLRLADGKSVRISTFKHIVVADRDTYVYTFPEEITLR